MRNLLILITFLFFLQKSSFAQDTLPKIKVIQIGNKSLISWYNPYTNVTNINIQRSGDSLRNFTTIGSVLNIGPGVNGFADQKEFIPANQYYRLFISFEGGSYIFTNSHRPEKDTLAEFPPIEKPEIVKPAETPKHVEKNIFVPSPHVYTGKDNNVIISLPDADTKKYSLKFYERDGTFLFGIKKVSQKYLILDKVNFRHAGLFIFELYDNKLIIERHKFFIPKDGRPMPLLDKEGNELRLR